MTEDTPTAPKPGPVRNSRIDQQREDSLRVEALNIAERALVAQRAGSDMSRDSIVPLARDFYAFLSGDEQPAKKSPDINETKPKSGGNLAVGRLLQETQHQNLTAAPPGNPNASLLDGGPHRINVSAGPTPAEVAASVQHRLQRRA
ncbi:hypothetical protein AS850_02960 [Frondihabitans sp. 762G35]|uniref:hypothetical protein n=1 Tax=Frondihabitans sp. 762G35 TaxID=1446794 RepID=UPI000D214E56|nr:hypothetical protein [Frondihabitans sp. 762G35]ARC56033.1 hypothetical protein AS850_02960 [Frondihabitans sp. 762G35]